MSISLPKDIESIIAKKKTDMETMGVMISLESFDMLIERNMRDAAYHFNVKCRSASSLMIDSVTFMRPMIARGKPATVALIKAFFANYMNNTESDDDEDEILLSEDDITVYVFQSASTIKDACKMENRNIEMLKKMSSMLFHDYISSSMYTVQMKRPWQFIDSVIDFIGTNELIDAK